MEFSVDMIAAVMHRHRSELLRYLAQRVSCPDAAQDLFQETFIRYAGYREKSAVENPRAFIFRIAANLATDYLRGRARQPQLAENEELSESFDLSSLSVEQTVISQQEFELLLQALAELPEKCRAVFIMLRLKEYSYAQVEQELGISSTMILKYLNRALSHCRQRLQAE